jgi:hypothetical protein
MKTQSSQFGAKSGKLSSATVKIEIPILVADIVGFAPAESEASIVADWFAGWKVRVGQQNLRDEQKKAKKAFDATRVRASLGASLEAGRARRSSAQEQKLAAGGATPDEIAIYRKLQKLARG